MRFTTPIAFFCSERFLLHRTVLWMLFFVNGLGTIYGFLWYGGQLVYTLEQKAAWLLIFVPDSPTASLFFTLSILYLLIDHHDPSSNPSGLGSVRPGGMIRGIIEAFAVITSLKYGIWAVVIIFSDAYLGNPLYWQHWMLVVSHTGMALEAILFARFFTFRWIHIGMIAVWTLCNDFMDYHFGVFPNLSYELQQFLPMIRSFTMSLSIMCIVFAGLALMWKLKQQERNGSTV